MNRTPYSLFFQMAHFAQTEQLSGEKTETAVRSSGLLTSLAMVCSPGNS